LFFSAGKDKLLKLWDGDTFEQVQELSAHTAEVWSLSVNAQGTGVLSAGNDKCVRVWSQSDQQLFLEEERETRLEALYDQGAQTEVKAMGAMAGGAMVAPAESALVARSQANEQSLQAGERLIEALDLADADVSPAHTQSRSVQAITNTAAFVALLLTPSFPCWPVLCSLCCAARALVALRRSRA
jgi:U3 small nucleolar RNA-associated protein 12